MRRPERRFPGQNVLQCELKPVFASLTDHPWSEYAIPPTDISTDLNSDRRE
ncbi:MAG: hypothetical protein Q4C47_09965 [Planctomycetia bacterium]|nr:hypothetical protein [Planctomycetia bacterium]